MAVTGIDEVRDGAERTPGDDGGIIIDNSLKLSDDIGETIPTLNPAEIIIPGDTVGNEPRRRGRQKGSRNKQSAKPSKESEQDLTGLLLSIHLMGAALLKTPELALTPDEAEQLGKAVARVNAEFGVQIMSPKMAAIVNLTIVAGTVYGPRAVAIYHNKAKDKAAKHPVNGAAAVADYAVN